MSLGWYLCYYYEVICMYVNAKMIPVERIPRIGEGKDKREWWKG
jgi:hypothetical protein